jgi:hypothetical protein
MSWSRSARPDGARSQARLAPSDIIVFLGPTLDRAEAARLLPARYLPPVACGDVVRALRFRPKVIAIVDGVFEHTGSVWHKEILFALDKGVAVFGAASMGALRAAELAPFGMRGVGRIFEAYRDGACTDDDEVAVLHAGGSGAQAALSEPLVNIRATLERAVAERIVPADVAERVVACAKATFYQERSLKHAVERARPGLAEGGRLDRLLHFAASGGYVDQKKLDALALIETLAALARPPLAVRRRTDRARRSAAFQALHAEVMCRPCERLETWMPEEERVALAASALGRPYALLRLLAQLLSLADGVARARGIVPGPADRKRVLAGGDLGLGMAARDPAWAARHGLDDAGLARLVRRLARIRRLVDSESRRTGSRGGGRRYLLALLRVHGDYERFRSPGRGRGAREAAVVRDLERRDPETFVLYRRLARLWRVVDRAAVARGVDVHGLPDELQDFADDFRADRNLETRAATRRWLTRNDLDGAGFHRLVCLWARLHILCQNAPTDTLGVATITDGVCWLHDALRLGGFYARLAPSPVGPPRARTADQGPATIPPSASSRSSTARTPSGEVT